jgi:hypothetical protein
LDSVVVGTSLDRQGPVPQRGYVDVLDCLRGVRGWALDLTNPGRNLRIELLAGAEPFADMLTHDAREDISLALGQPVTPGFVFHPDQLTALFDHADNPDEVVTVRIAGTPCVLSSAEAAPTVGALIAELERIADPGPQTSHITDFDTLLEELRASAATLATEGLSPIAENEQGFVETLATDSAGQVWMVGWMRRGHFSEFAAVISDRRKHPAAVALMSYTRDDLPPNACGVIGLISSPWRPVNANSAFYMFFGGGGRFHLKANTPLRMLSAAELAVEYEFIRDRLLGDGRTAALTRMLGALETWSPTREGTHTYATETSLDRVLVVPGLGCLVEGWVISPMKRIQGLRLRFGGAAMTARSDALQGYPGSEALVARAGFVGLFTGDAEPDDFADPVFKVVFEGGVSANWKVPPRVFRRLGHSAAIDEALQFFPALLEEPFFPLFAKAAIAAYRGDMHAPVKLSVNQSKRALVVVLPEDRCDLFLAFEDLAQQCRTALKPDGVIFIGSSKTNRSDALWLFREFQAGNTLKCSLVVIEDAAIAFAQLPGILRDAGVSRFVFLGAGVFLSETGWRHARDYLKSASQDLVFLGLAPDEHDHRDPDAAISARCFGWTTHHFTVWSQNAGTFLGGYHRDNGLLRGQPAHVLYRAAARASRTQLGTRIENAVNAAVYGMAMPLASPAQ